MNSSDEAINISSLSKAERYEYCESAIRGISDGEPDLTANLANTAAILSETFAWWWVGFYMVRENELVLGPFQGPVACTRIAYGKGVCGKAWETAESLVVPDVHAFPGHIACSAASNSEIVVPISKNGKVVAVLDADSEFLSHFDDADKLGLERIAKLVSGWF